MTRRTAPAAVAALALGSQPLAGQDSQDIIGITSPDGRVVLTNMGGGYQPDPRSDLVISPPLYQELIEGISLSHGVDPHLTRAIIEVESHYNAHAVSARGALGLMQLVPATGERFGVNDFFDPAENIAGGVRFLRFLIEKFRGNTDLVLAAYNSGENRVERLGRVPAIPETVDYIRKVRSAYRQLAGEIASVLGPVAELANQSASPTIYRSVDERGVRKFSGFGPPR